MPSEREAAEARVAERNHELRRLQTQVEKREAAMPLRKDRRDLQKIWCDRFLVAAGATIGAIFGAIPRNVATLAEKNGK